MADRRERGFFPLGRGHEQTPVSIAQRDHTPKQVAVPARPPPPPAVSRSLPPPPPPPASMPPVRHEASVIVSPGAGFDEFEVMRRVNGLLNSLSPEERAWVLAWANAKFGGGGRG